MQHFLCGLVLRCKTVRFAVANGLSHLRERFGMLRMRGLAPLERFGTAFAVRFGAEARGGGFMHTGGYEGLVVYNKAIELSEEIGALVTKLPKHEKYELASQLRRAADSTSSNISEGNGRSTIKDYISFLYNAKGSTQEVQTQFTSLCCSWISDGG